MVFPTLPVLISRGVALAVDGRRWSHEFFLPSAVSFSPRTDELTGQRNDFVHSPAHLHARSTTLRPSLRRTRRPSTRSPRHRPSISPIATMLTRRVPCLLRSTWVHAARPVVTAGPAAVPCHRHLSGSTKRREESSKASTSAPKASNLVPTPTELLTVLQETIKVSQRRLPPPAILIWTRSRQTHGPLPVSRYMTLCLAHPTLGYYTTKKVFGSEGDFVTSPEISQIFGEVRSNVLLSFDVPTNRRLECSCSHCGMSPSGQPRDARRKSGS